MFFLNDLSGFASLIVNHTIEMSITNACCRCGILTTYTPVPIKVHDEQSKYDLLLKKTSSL
ncbi:hypothetical protein ABIB62_004437 [Mucilaginibacter sp. UYP25]